MEKVKKVWDDSISRDHRVQTDFKQKDTEEVIKKYKVLASDIAPDLVRFFHCILFYFLSKLQNSKIK